MDRFRHRPRRRSAPLVTLIGVTLSFASAGASAETLDLPVRRPGLWRISTLSPEVGLATHDVCIEAGDSLIGSIDETCEKPAVEAAQDQWIVTLSCRRAGGRETTSLLFTGDFSSWYRAQAKSTYTRADGTAAQGSGFTIDAKFLGPECPKAGP